jgi:hypothetical protein
MFSLKVVRTTFLSSILIVLTNAGKTQAIEWKPIVVSEGGDRTFVELDSISRSKELYGTGLCTS